MKKVIIVCVLVVLMVCGCVTAMALTQQEEEVTVTSSTTYSVGSYRGVVIEPLKSKTFSVKRPIVEQTSYAGYQCTSYYFVDTDPNTYVVPETYVYVLDEKGKVRGKRTRFTGKGTYSIKYNHGPLEPYPETEKMKLVVENYANDGNNSKFFSFQSTALWSPNRQAFA